VNPPKDPILAAILSVLFPGLGQFYCRQWGRGALFLVGSILTFALIPDEGPVIDIGRPRLPSIDIRQALIYIGIPVGIVALLAIIVVFILVRYGLWGDWSSSKRLEPLMAKIEAYKVQTGSYPDSLQALIDPTDPIEKKQTLDPWGNPYMYRTTQGGFELLSSGQDGKPDTKDDIRYYP